MRLIDCFAELISYTLYLKDNLSRPDLAYETVRQDYERLFEISEKHRRSAGDSDEDYQDARFAICAWVDECMLSSSWPARNAWEKEQLQRIHFGTNNAGEEFYIRLEKLPPEKKEVREVFVICLGLGFTGRFYREEQKPLIRSLIEKNLKLLMETDFESAGAAERELFPSAHALTSSKAQRKLFRRLDLFTAFFLIAPVILAGALFFVYTTILDKALGAFFGAIF